MVLTALLISTSPVDCSREDSTIAVTLTSILPTWATIRSECLAGLADEVDAAFHVLARRW